MLNALGILNRTVFVIVDWSVKLVTDREPVLNVSRNPALPCIVLVLISVVYKLVIRAVLDDILFVDI